MAAVFRAVWHASAAGSLLILAVLVLRLALKKAPRRVLCLLWAVAAVRLACPFAPQTGFSLVPRAAGAQLLSAVGDGYAGETVTLYDNSDGYAQAVAAGRTPIPAGEGRYYVVTAEDGVSAPRTLADTLLPAVWLCGAAALLGYAALSYRRVRRMVAGAAPPVDGVCLCEGLGTPFILGMLRPCIYLPASLSPAQRAAVLAHERAHLRRRDHWWKPLGFALLAVHWFNPLCHLAYGLLCRDIELACDEAAIRDMEPAHRREYAATLLACSLPGPALAACPLTFDETAAGQRIRAVVAYKKPALWLIVLGALACAAVAALFLTERAPAQTALLGGEYTVSALVCGAEEDLPTDFCLTPSLDLYRWRGAAAGWEFLGRMAGTALSKTELQALAGGRARLSGAVTGAARLAAAEGCFWAFQTSRGETYLGWGGEHELKTLCRVESTLRAQSFESGFFARAVQSELGAPVTAFALWQEDAHPGWRIVGFLEETSGLPGFAVFCAPPEAKPEHQVYRLVHWALYDGPARGESDQCVCVMEQPAVLAEDAFAVVILQGAAEEEVSALERVCWRQDAEVLRERYTVEVLPAMLVMQKNAMERENADTWSLYRCGAAGERQPVYLEQLAVHSGAYVPDEPLYARQPALLSSAYGPGGAGAFRLALDGPAFTFCRGNGMEETLEAPGASWQPLTDADWRGLFPTAREDAVLSRAALCAQPRALWLSSEWMLFDMGGALLLGEYRGEKTGIWNLWALRPRLPEELPQDGPAG